ncbi:hypothetical protein [Pseudomonas sp. Marseille-QA0892]
MKKWIFTIALVCTMASYAQSEPCGYTPPEAVEHSPNPISSQRLVLGGPNRLELGLVQAPHTFAHSRDILIAKYANGATFASRQLAESEVRTESNSALSLPDFVRLMFLGAAPAASRQDQKEAQVLRDALRLGCSDPSYRWLDGVDVFGYIQTRQGGERYHAYYVIDGDIVHYLDISGTDAFAEQIISTLHKRN